MTKLKVRSPEEIEYRIKGWEYQRLAYIEIKDDISISTVDEIIRELKWAAGENNRFILRRRRKLYK